MGAGHGHRLHFHGHSRIHRAPGHWKIVILLGFVLLAVALPARYYPAYGVLLAVVVSVILLAGVPLLYIVKRMVIEVPFVVFAVLLPFIATGPKTEFLGLTVSEAGLIAAGTLLAKATLGVMAALTLAATTESDEVLRGLQRLRLPDLLVQIMSFMIRYLDVVIADLSRMMVSMRSRGCDPKWPKHWPALGKSLGALFIRSYERGERVHLAMLSRGYDGRLPRS